MMHHDRMAKLAPRSEAVRRVDDLEPEHCDDADDISDWTSDGIDGEA